MKKSIALFITIVFMLVLMVIVGKILKNSNKYIDEYSSDIFLIQLNYVIEDFEKGILKLSSQDIDDIVSVANLGVNINYGNSKLKLYANKLEVSKCDINAYSEIVCAGDSNTSCLDAKNSCNILFEKLIDSGTFIEIIKSHLVKNETIINKQQFKYLMNEYANITQDSTIFKKLPDSSIYYLHLKYPLLNNLLNIKLNGTIIANNILVDITYDIRESSKRIFGVEVIY
jgi:hypothetical protein